MKDTCKPMCNNMSSVSSLDQIWPALRPILNRCEIAELPMSNRAQDHIVEIRVGSGWNSESEWRAAEDRYISTHTHFLGIWDQKSANTPYA